MLHIDFTQIDNYEETFNQCDTRLADAIGYIQSTIIPFLGNFTEIDKESQSVRIDEIVNFTSELVHLLNTVYDLDINKGTSQDYHSEETQTVDDCDDEIQCVP